MVALEEAQITILILVVNIIIVIIAIMMIIRDSMVALEEARGRVRGKGRRMPSARSAICPKEVMLVMMMA